MEFQIDVVELEFVDADMDVVKQRVEDGSEYYFL